jgi:DNA mismatch repair protein MutL
MSIRRLPEHLVNRIAAGEVVERPASALKELVENAIDAGATRIAIVLAGGGRDRIEVADDGMGMARDEIALALERHCTSKLPDDAIDQVSTLGFRGEALPSIASVARLTIESRRRGADGWSVTVDNGAREGEGPAAIPPGTRLTVEQLFARVPARRKFLRSERSEYAACLDVVKRLAMARPEIGFTLEHDGRRALTLTPGEDRPLRVSALTSRELAENSLAVDFEREGVRLGGVAGLPTFNRGVADHQYLFVNGRPVKDRLLIGAVRAAYQDLLARDRAGRRQRPPGQDRGPLPRPGDDSRVDRRRAAACAGRGRPSQRAAAERRRVGGVAAREPPPAPPARAGGELCRRYLFPLRAFVEGAGGWFLFSLCRRHPARLSPSGSRRSGQRTSP